MRTTIGLTLVFIAMFGFYRLGFKHGYAAAPAPSCRRELEQAERCIYMVERANRVNQLCIDLLGAMHDAGTY